MPMMTRPLGSIAAWLSIGAVLMCVVIAVAIAYLAGGDDMQLASNVTRMAEHRPPLLGQRLRLPHKGMIETGAVFQT